jgi:hypothetical protein
MLKAHKLSAMDLQPIQNVLEALPSSLLQKGDVKPLIVDTGCSQTVTGFANYFVPGTFKNTVTPIKWMALEDLWKQLLKDKYTMR